MNAFLVHLAYEFRSGLRQKQLLLMNYLFPLGFFLLMGFIMTGINPAFRENLIPAMVMLSTLAATLMGIPIMLTTAREKGILRTYRINGIPALSILIITAIRSALHLLIVSAIITVSAPILFDAALPVNWGAFFLTLVLTALTCATLSALIGVIAPSTQASILLAQFIFVVSIMLGGLMFPFRMLPEAARKAALLFPASHAMNLFNVLAMQQTEGFSTGISAAVMCAGSLLAFALAVRLFRWDPQDRVHPLRLTGVLIALLPYAASIFLVAQG